MYILIFSSFRSVRCEAPARHMPPKKEPEPEAAPEEPAAEEPETGSGAFFFPDGSKYGVPPL